MIDGDKSQHFAKIIIPTQPDLPNIIQSNPSMLYDKQSIMCRCIYYLSRPIKVCMLHKNKLKSHPI